MHRNNMIGVSAERFHGLDFLRAVAMILGLVFHAPLLYYIPILADGFHEFGISSMSMPDLEGWLSFLLQWLHSWRMVAFFLLSGFFSALVLRKRSPNFFIANRATRVGATMVLFISLYDLLDGSFDGTLFHGWFLYYLLIFNFLIWILATTGLLTFKKESILTHNTNDKNRLNFAKKSSLILAVFLVILRPFCDYLDGGEISIAVTYFSIPLGGLLYFLTWFSIGFWLFQNQNIIDDFKSDLSVAVLGIIGLIIFVLLYPNLSGFFGSNGFSIYDWLDFLILSSIKGLNTLVWVTFMVATAQKLIRKSSKLLAWLVTLSYPIYLFHLLPCMVVSAFLIGLGFSQFAVVIITVSAAFTISIIAYYLFVKFTPLSWLILGYTNSWMQPLKRIF